MPGIGSLPASLLCLLAALVPPERPTAIPDLAGVDDTGAARDLRQIATGAPALLLPVFTRCTGTCPMTAVYLKDALAKAQVSLRVVVLSFDADDTPADLRDFRERFALPPDWLVVRPSDAGATRAFLDRLDFHFMKSEAGFDHPNETFVFSPHGTWAATLTGAAFAPGELRAAQERALAADDPSAASRLAAWLHKPEAWIVLACVGILLALAAILARRSQRQSHRSSAHSSVASR